MRRVTRTDYFVIAACGGTDMRQQSPNYDSRSPQAERQAFLLSPDAAAVIASFARDHSEQALDTCLNAWVDEVGSAGAGEGPIQKPSVASLRGFLAQCLSDPTTGDVRTNSPDVRTAGADLRAAGVGRF